MGWNGPVLMDKLFDGLVQYLPGSLVSTSLGGDGPLITWGSGLFIH